MNLILLFFLGFEMISCTYNGKIKENSRVNRKLELQEVDPIIGSSFQILRSTMFAILPDSLGGKKLKDLEV